MFGKKAEVPTLEDRGAWYLDGIVVQQAAPGVFFIGLDPEHPDLTREQFDEKVQAFDSVFPDCKIVPFYGPIHYRPPVGK